MCRHLTVFAQQLLHAGQLAGCPEIPASRSAAPERVSQSKPSASTAATGWRGTHLYPDPVVAAPLSSTNRLDTACGGGGANRTRKLLPTRGRLLATRKRVGSDGKGGAVSARGNSHEVIGSAQLDDAALPVALLPQDLVDLVIQISDPELAQRCCAHAKHTRDQHTQARGHGAPMQRTENR